MNPPAPEPFPTNDDFSEAVNWVDSDHSTNIPMTAPSPTSFTPRLPHKRKTLVTVETAFLASTASLIWLINYFFPLGPVLRIFFPIPTALAYLRWNSRAAWMTALVSGVATFCFDGANPKYRVCHSLWLDGGSTRELVGAVAATGSFPS